MQQNDINYTHLENDSAAHENEKSGKEYFEQSTLGWNAQSQRRPVACLASIYTPTRRFPSPPLRHKTTTTSHYLVTRKQRETIGRRQVVTG